MKNYLFRRIYGSLIGGAIGDAMGAPLENMHYLDIREQFGKVDTFLELIERYVGGRPIYEVPSFYWHERKKEPVRTIEQILFPFSNPEEKLREIKIKPGTHSDDTWVKLVCYRSIIKHRRRITGYEFAQDIIDYLITCGEYNHSDPRYIWAKGMWKLDEIIAIVTKNPFGNSPLVGGIWGEAGGIINAGDPRNGAQDGGIMGAIIAMALHPEATVESIIDTAFKYSKSIFGGDYDLLPHTGEIFSQRLEKALNIANKCGDVFELIEDLYKWILVTYPPWYLMNILEVIPVALAMVYKAKGKFEEAIIGGVNFGRDCDTLASLCGEICGALNGVTSIPEKWISTVEQANPDDNLKKVSMDLTNIVIEETKRFQKITGDLLKESEK